jgi:alpha-beta hydrolase superfamily lysophospholipase
MPKKIILFLFILSGCSSMNIQRRPQSVSELNLSQILYNTNVPGIKTVKLRTGVMEASPEFEFKGCVLYLEGLADSIRNHSALFTALSNAGFRVVAFDYIGQGGSEGSMNHTRVQDPLLPGLEIGHQAKAVWESQSEKCANSQKFVIGWSTGGLAAYALAHEGWADGVVLIAPGIHPNKLVGEAAENPLLLATLKQVITERTLTSNTFENSNNPHVDPIKPVSPAVVPLFAANLLSTALLSQQWKIPADVRGYVFLSGKEDTYVDRDATKAILSVRAPQFSVKEYDHALHEIDNEVPAISQDMINRTVKFFESAN